MKDYIKKNIIMHLWKLGCDFFFRIKMKYLLSFMSFFNQSLSQKDHIKII